MSTRCCSNLTDVGIWRRNCHGWNLLAASPKYSKDLPQNLLGPRQSQWQSGSSWFPCSSGPQLLGSWEEHHFPRPVHLHPDNHMAGVTLSCCSPSDCLNLNDRARPIDYNLVSRGSSATTEGCGRDGDVPVAPPGSPSSEEQYNRSGAGLLVSAAAL
jgi:hypothetical protein